MKIGGFQKLSLMDYPGKISCIVFTAGCNFRCPFCYNTQLVLPEEVAQVYDVPQDLIFSFLKHKQGLTEGVVITGGEPTLHADLPEFIKKIRALGFAVKLDTNGTNPVMLKSLINGKLVDYVAMDLKASFDFERYNAAVGGVLTEKMFEDIKKSAKMLIDSGIEHEFRTTLVAELHDEKEIVKMCKDLKGAKRYWLQSFLSSEKLVGGKPLTRLDDKVVQKAVDEGKQFLDVRYRGQSPTQWK
jgi:pyruvate formate lyase activating enzyme